MAKCIIAVWALVFSLFVAHAAAGVINPLKQKLMLQPVEKRVNNRFLEERVPRPKKGAPPIEDDAFPNPIAVWK